MSVCMSGSRSVPPFNFVQLRHYAETGRSKNAIAVTKRKTLEEAVLPAMPAIPLAKRGQGMCLHHQSLFEAWPVSLPPFPSFPSVAR